MSLPSYLRTDHQARVEDMMEKAGQDLPSLPCYPPYNVRLLRAKLIVEECLETIFSLGFNLRVKSYGAPPLDGVPISNNSLIFVELPPPPPEEEEEAIIDVIDGCCDIHVVTTGTLSAFGIADMIPLQEVDDNNLQKFSPPPCPACDTDELMTFVAERWFCSVCKTTADKNHGPYRREDGKWMKPFDHQPPNLKAVLAKLTTLIQGETVDE